MKPSKEFEDKLKAFAQEHTRTQVYEEFFERLSEAESKALAKAFQNTYVAGAEFGYSEAVKELSRCDEETPYHHPSSIYEWYTEGKRHPDGGKAFVAWPDHVRALQSSNAKLMLAENRVRELEEKITALNLSPKTVNADLQKAFDREHSRAEALKKKLEKLESELKGVKS